MTKRDQVTAARPGPGPKTATATRRSSLITFRGTPELEAELELWVTERGVTRSELLRNIVCDLIAKRKAARLARPSARAA